LSPEARDVEADHLQRGEVRGDGFEPRAQPPLQLDLFPEARDVEADHLQRGEARPVQAVPDLLQREAELPQRQHLLQAGDVGCGVEPVSRRGVQARPEQADRVAWVLDKTKTCGVPEEPCPGFFSR
jgi:hypothetical protein